MGRHVVSGTTHSYAQAADLRCVRESVGPLVQLAKADKQLLELEASFVTLAPRSAISVR